MVSSIKIHLIYTENIYTKKRSWIYWFSFKFIFIMTKCMTFWNININTLVKKNNNNNLSIFEAYNIHEIISWNAGNDYYNVYNRVLQISHEHEICILDVCKFSIQNKISNILYKSSYSKITLIKRNNFCIITTYSVKTTGHPMNQDFRSYI